MVAPVMAYAVLDVETTGLSPGYHHRIVEIGVVLLDRRGAVTDEWCTLLNPQRDLGPQHIHHIRADEVRNAPTFADIAADLAKYLAGRVTVAHNLRFDLRFLEAEYARLGVRVPLGYDQGLCTMHLAGRYLDSPARSLVACCASAGIDHSEQHSALHDARACANLLACFLRSTGRPEPWSELWTRATKHRWPALPAGCGRTCRRHAPNNRQTTFLARLIDRLPRVQQPARADDYLALLDRALLDRQLSASEQDALIDAAQGLDLTFTDTMELHRAYLAALAAAAWQDGIVSETERSDLLAVAGLLGLSTQDVDIVVDKAKTGSDVAPRDRFRLTSGDVVAFTGQMPGAREQWEERAALRGLKVTDNLIRATRLLVAADPDSLSGKARKARQYGIPIISVQAFESLLLDVKDDRR
jgi:DNA polymerase-3 subunit epsilon